MTPGNNVIEVVLQLVDNITKPLQSIQSKLGGLQRLGLAALGGWSIQKFVANIAEADKVTAKLDNAFRNLGAGSGVTREQLNDLAKSVQRASTFSSNSVKEAEIALLSFNKVTGDTFERAIKLASNMAASMGTDIPSAAQRLGRSLQDPQMGLALLRRSGIALSLQQRELIKDMVKAGDTFGAQDQILAALETRYANSAATMRNTLGGAITALQHQIGDLIEGDSGSFKNAIDAINELTETLNDPRIKSGGDILVATLANIGAGIAQLAAGVLVDAASIGEAWGRLFHGSTNVGQRFADDLAKVRVEIAKLEKDIPGIEMAVRLGYGGQLPAKLKASREQLVLLRAEEERLNKLRAQEITDQNRLVVTAPVKPKPVITGERGERIDIDAVVNRASALQESLRSEVQKTTEMVSSEIRNLALVYKQELLDPGSTGYTTEELDKMVAGLQQTLGAAVAKEQEAAKKSGKALTDWNAQTQTAVEKQLATWREYSKQIENLVATGKITPEVGAARMEEAGQGLEGFKALQRVQAESQTELEGTTASIRELQAALAQLYLLSDKELIKLGVTPEEIAAAVGELNKMVDKAIAASGSSSVGALETIRGATSTDVENQLQSIRQLGQEIATLYRMTDEQLLILKVDRSQLDAAVAGLGVMVDKVAESQYKVSEFAIQSARTLQTTFADAFMSIGEGWNSVVTNFLNSFKRILAEAAAMQLARAIGLEDILAGKKPTSKVGQILEKIFPPMGESGKPHYGGGSEGNPPGVLSLIGGMFGLGGGKKGGGLEEIVIAASRIGMRTGVDSSGRPSDKVYPVDRQGFPIDTDRPRLDTGAEDEYATEETITEFVDGLWRNIPTIVDGVRVTAEEAVDAAIAAIAKGWKFPSFGTLEEAVGAATDRSSTIGAVRGAIGGGPDEYGLEDVIVKATRIGGDGGLVEDKRGDCAMNCAEQVVTTVSQTIGGSVAEAISTYGAQFGEYVRGIGAGLWEMLKGLSGGLWKFLSGFLGKIWDFIKAAIAAIRGMASSGGGDGGGGGWIGTAVKVIGAYFGAAAMGGALAVGSPILVGEEAPEIVAPRAGGGALVRSLRHYEARVGEETPELLVSRAGGGPLVVGASGPEVVRSERAAQVYNVRQLEFAGLMSRSGTDHREQLAGKMGALVTGGNAGGGLISAMAGARRVGEETPEVVSPGNRLMRFIGETAAARLAEKQSGGGAPAPQVSYSPQYNVSFSRVKDDEAMLAQFMLFVKRSDEQTKREIMEMMKRNGHGRMQR